jgi:hypothetical protein
VAKHFNGEKFLYAANKDYSGHLLDLDNAHEMARVPHGLNQYDSEVNCYFGPALNRQPIHQKLMINLGFSSQIMKSATLHEATYQAIMRTALRDPESTQLVRCVVPEYETAVRLVHIFNTEIQLKWIGDESYKKVKPLTDTQRNKRSRFNKKRDELFEATKNNVKLGGYVNLSHSSPLLPRNDDNSLICIKENSNHIGAEIPGSDSENLQTSYRSGANGGEAHDFYITFHGHIRNKSTEEFVVEPFNHQAITKWMREFANVVNSNKDELFLFNPTIFGDFDSEGHRRQVNFLQSSLMVLDFDNGLVSIKDFERIFWKEAGRAKHSFIICNTFSRNENEPNRFRVMFLYKTPVKSIKVHQAIYDSIASKLSEHGFPPETSGLDSVCRSGVQSYYMPCINQRHQEWAYYKQWGTKSREIAKYAIDPELIEKTMMSADVKPKLLNVDDNTIYFEGGGNKEDRIESILSAVRCLPQDRHSPFYIAAWKLRHLELPDHEIQFHLEQLEADIGKTSEGWAKYAMQSLRRRQ